MNPTVFSPGPVDRSASGNTGYALAARAIRYLRANADRQPDLQQLASELGCGEAVLRRTFSALAGVSPKRFLQFLTKEHARRLLLDSASVLEAALATGLSGPGRLHDLMVSTEAMTPGEIGRQGAGVELRYGFTTTPLGAALAAATARGLAYFGFVDDDAGGAAAALADLQGRWPRAALREDAAVQAVADRAFAAWREQRPLHLVLAGTNFQLKVWEALLAVPEGALISYTGLARAIGRPDAVRAVASAVGRNPVSLLIPCHRVIRESGDLGGYHWGLSRKSAIIAIESARRELALGAAA